MIISTLHHDKPRFTERCIDSLKQVRGIENCKIFCTLDKREDETVNEEVLSLLKGIDFCEKTLKISSIHRGKNKSVGFALTSVYRNDNLIFHVDDDVTVSKDSLELAEDVCLSKHFRRYNVFSLYEKKKKEEIYVEDYSLISSRSTFTPFGFVISREMASTLLSEKHWTKEYPWVSSLRERGMRELYPRLSRSLSLSHSKPNDFWAGELETKYTPPDYTV